MKKPSGWTLYTYRGEELVYETFYDLVEGIRQHEALDGIEKVYKGTTDLNFIPIFDYSTMGFSINRKELTDYQARILSRELLDMEV